jgi:hypothetical protein
VCVCVCGTGVELRALRLLTGTHHLSHSNSPILRFLIIHHDCLFLSTLSTNHVFNNFPLKSPFKNPQIPQKAKHTQNYHMAQKFYLFAYGYKKNLKQGLRFLHTSINFSMTHYSIAKRWKQLKCPPTLVVK